MQILKMTPLRRDELLMFQVYLVDYGLAYRYCPDGVHKESKENPKKGHNGTIEYTSLDAHKGLSKPLISYHYAL